MSTGVLHPASEGVPFTILVVGADRRNRSSPDVARGDQLMAVRVDLAGKHVSVLSIPRDLWVAVRATGKMDRINAALGEGPEQQVTTVERALGLPINHLLEIDMAGLPPILNAIGGVRLDIANPLRDAFSALTISTPGCQTLTGEQGLALARSRHLQYFADGQWRIDRQSDLSRIARNQLLLFAAGQRVRAMGTNPARLAQLVQTFATNASIDSGLTGAEMLRIARLLLGVDSSNLQFMTLPVVPKTIAKQNVLEQGPGAEEMLAAFRAGMTRSTTASGAPPAAVGVVGAC